MEKLTKTLIVEESKIKLIYNQTIEASENQYNEMMRIFKGILASRKDKELGKYFIKIWMMKYKANVEAYLNQ